MFLYPFFVYFKPINVKISVKTEKIRSSQNEDDPVFVLKLEIVTLEGALTSFFVHWGAIFIQRTYRFVQPRTSRYTPRTGSYSKAAVVVVKSI